MHGLLERVIIERVDKPEEQGEEQDLSSRLEKVTGHQKIHTNDGPTFQVSDIVMQELLSEIVTKILMQAELARI